MNNPFKANQWLSRFSLEITSNSNRVYANGRQQVEVTVTLEARNNETISEESLASLQLVQLDDNGNIVVLDGGLLADIKKDERFDYYAATGVAPRRLLHASTRTFRRRFYVNSTLPGGTLSTLYASIFKDQNNRVETHDGPFKSAVTIESITPPRLTKEHFELVMEDADHDEKNLKIDLGHLGFRDPNNRISQTYCFDTPSADAFYVRRVWEHSLISFTGSNDYSSETYIYAFEPGQPFEWERYGRPVTINKRPNKITLLRTRHQFYRRFVNETWEKPCKWGVLDQYGNEHIIELFGKDNGERIDFRVNE